MSRGLGPYLLTNQIGEGDRPHHNLCLKALRQVYFTSSFLGL